MLLRPLIVLALSGVVLSSLPGYSRNLLHREYRPGWLKTAAAPSTHGGEPVTDDGTVTIDDVATIQELLSEGKAAAGPVCRAGDAESPKLALELQDGRLLTWCLIETNQEKRKVIEAITERPYAMGQAVFDFLVYNGECFAPRGETSLQVLEGAVWKDLEIGHLENWGEAESIGPVQRMGHVRWIFNLGGRTCSGVRLLFSDGLENNVVCTAVSAFNEIPIKEYPKISKSARPVPAGGVDLLPVTRNQMWFSSGAEGDRITVPTLPFEFRMTPGRSSVSVQFAYPLMLSSLGVKYQSEVETELAMEMFVEGQKVSVGIPQLRKEDEGGVFTLAPVAVDRIDLIFSARHNGKVNLLSIAASLDDAGQRALQMVADSPEDIWAKRLLARGEPNYPESAALMLPRRDYRTVVGSPDDLDETAVEWNGTMFLRRRDDPRGPVLERFFAFRLDGEVLGKDFDALQGGWTDGAQELSPGSLPERWVRYEKDDVSATLRAFGGVDGEGSNTHLLWMEVLLQNRSARVREGSLEVVTGLRRCGKSGRISLYWDLPVFDTVSRESERLLVDALGQPILLADSPFELAGTEAEPACRFTYRLAPGGSQKVGLAAVVDCKPDKSYLPRKTLTEARSAFSRFWNRKLASGMKLTLPEKRLEQIYPHFLSQCLIVPDHGVPVYGSFFYEDTLCVEEVWPTVALAQFGFFDEAQTHAESMLEISSDDTRTRHKQYRKGLAPACAWNVYQLSRNQKFLQRVFPLMADCCEYIISERHKTMSLKDGRKTGFHGLLPRFVYGGDIGDSAYGLYANACAWRGLRDSSLAAAVLGDVDLARRWRGEADSYRKDIMAVIERVTDRQSVPIFTPLSLGRNAKDPDEVFPAGDPTPEVLHQDQISSYWPLFAALLLETGLFEPNGEYTTGMLNTFRKKAGLWDGQVRFAYVEPNWDPHYGYGLHRTWQRRDERHLFLTAFYGFLANNMSRDSWVHGEVSNVFPLRTQNFAQREFAYDRVWRQPGWKGSEPLSSGPGIILSDLRDMLVCEERDALDEVNGGLSLLRHAPGAWLVDGSDIIVEDAPTAYGKLSYRVQCNLERQRAIFVSMQLEAEVPVLVRVYANPINLGTMRTAKWSHAADSRLEANWTQAEVKGKAEVKLQF